MKRATDLFERLAQRAVSPPRILPRLASRFELQQPQPFAATEPNERFTEQDVGDAQSRAHERHGALNLARPADHAVRESVRAESASPRSSGEIPQTSATDARLEPERPRPVASDAATGLESISTWKSPWAADEIVSKPRPEIREVIERVEDASATPVAARAEHPAPAPIVRLERDRIERLVTPRPDSNERAHTARVLANPVPAAPQPSTAASRDHRSTHQFAPLEITIGRIEIVAAPPDSARRAPHEVANLPPPRLALDHYLRERGGGRR
jgi:hypothetical protein